MMSGHYQRNFTTKGNGRLILEIPREIVERHGIKKGTCAQIHENSSSIEIRFHGENGQPHLEDFLATEGSETEVLGIDGLTELSNPLVITRKVDPDRIVEREYYQRVKNDLLGKTRHHRGEVFVVFKFVGEQPDISNLRTLAYLQLQISGNIVIADDYLGDRTVEWIAPLNPRYVLKIPRVLLSF